MLLCERSAEPGLELVALHALSLNSVPSAQKRGASSNTPWCCGLMSGQGSTRGRVWCVVCYENRCALLCICLVLVSNVICVNEKVDVIVNTVGLIRLHRVAALTSVSFINVICDCR